MKQYVKPTLEQAVLRCEERFAAGSGCTITGSCTEAEKKAMAAQGIFVNYS